MGNEQILPFLPAVLQVVIRGMLAVLNRRFRLFQNLNGCHLVVGLDLGQIDDLGRLHDEIRRRYGRYDPSRS